MADLGNKLAQALYFLHSANIVHRDLSPRNIILGEEGGDPTSPKAASRLSLAMVKDQNPVTGDILATEPIRFMHSARRYHSHGEYWAKERLTARFGNPNDEKMLELGTEAALQIAAYVRSQSIPQLVHFLLADQR